MIVVFLIHLFFLLFVPVLQILTGFFSAVPFRSKPKLHDVQPSAGDAVISHTVSADKFKPAKSGT